MIWFEISGKGFTDDQLVGVAKVANNSNDLVRNQLKNLVKY